MKFLNVGCGPHYVNGWTNVDVYQDDLFKPDFIIERNSSLPFEDSHFDAVYMGHVIEHIEWEKVSEFLMEVIRVTKSGAPVLIVSPDTKRTIDLYSNGFITWEEVETIIEHQHLNFQNSKDNSFWDGASHFWNCSCERVSLMLDSLKIENKYEVSDEILRYPFTEKWYDLQNGIIWPIVAKVHWQFGLLFKNKK